MALDLGSLLKGYRTAAGFTQEELAERAAVSARTVSDVERGLRTRIYRDTAGRLAEALGLDEPARSDFASAARGRPAEPAPSEAIPVPPTRLIGRDRELEVVLGALARPDVRLLTLTGPGGIGKTRIAVEAARGVERAFFVQLGNTSDTAMVIPAVARVVGVSGAKEPTVEAVAERLRAQPALIVLDTFEHVLDAAADVAALLAVSPDVTILTTSREALRVRGEHEVAIPTLESSPSAALFLERARAVKPDLPVDDQTTQIVADICHRVNGLPLAIELAAARVKHLSLAELRDHLQHRLSVLTEGPRDLPRRQQTMRDTVAWSYDLLDPGEQALFRDLSVFAGGWTLEAAAAVGGGTDVLAGLSGLVDKSLVTVSGEVERRYGMLDVIREFGAEMRNDEGAAQRHGAYFLSLAERAEPELGGYGQHVWSRRLTAEHDNIRTALRSALARRDAETALRTAGAVWRFWLLQGDMSEGRQWLREAIELDPAAPPAACAKALWGEAWLAYHQGDYEAARRCGEQLLPIARASDDPVLLRNALTIRGIVAMAFGRFDEAVGLLSEGVDLVRGLGTSWLLATSSLNLGMACIHAGDDGRARAMLEEARAMYEEIGDQHFTARTILYSGYAALLRGETAAAASLFDESLVTFWELADLWGTTEALEGSASVAAAEGAAARAARIAGACETLREAGNSRPFPFDHAVLERSLAGARASMTPDEWASSSAHGRALSAEEAVEYALSRDERR